MMPACSVTRIGPRFAVPLNGSSSRGWAPQRSGAVLMPASASSFDVMGDFQLPWYTRLGYARPLPVASIVVVAVPPPKQVLHWCCSSQNAVNLFFGVACQVIRPLVIH